MKRITKSKQFLQEACRVSEVDGKFYQQTERVGLKELKPFIQIAKHKYGTDIPYEYITLYNYEKHKSVLMSYHSFIYAWYKEEVPSGYDVDHIDGDTMNNHIDNLQLLTHEENIKKRGKGKNQYTAAKENGLVVDKSNYKKKECGYKCKHSVDYYINRARKQIEKTKALIEEVKKKDYKYEKAKENALKKLEDKLEEEIQSEQNNQN